MPIRTDNGLMLTYEDYVKFPKDGRRHEIIDGRHIVSPAPLLRHQNILFKLCGALQILERTGQAVVYPSPVDVRITESDIVQPDLVAVALSSPQKLTEDKVEGPPELVVEVLSPSTRRLDRGAKRALYESSGVMEYWILDPEARTLCQHTLVGKIYTEVLHSSGEVFSTAFPDLRVTLAEIFGEPGGSG